MRWSWSQLPSKQREDLDALLRRRTLLPAIMAMREVSEPDCVPTWEEARELLSERMGWLSARGLIEPEPELSITFEAALAAASSARVPVAAIEAIWDGDSAGWMVKLYAIVRRPSHDHHRFDEVFLGVFRGRSGDFRVFTGEVPPWPESAAATAVGAEVAEVLGVPFHFTQSGTPGVDLARWWDDAPA